MSLADNIYEAIYYESQMLKIASSTACSKMCKVDIET
jgi:hypothetical protein